MMMSVKHFFWTRRLQAAHARCQSPDFWDQLRREIRGYWENIWSLSLRSHHQDQPYLHVQRGVFELGEGYRWLQNFYHHYYSYTSTHSLGRTHTHTYTVRVKVRPLVPIDRLLWVVCKAMQSGWRPYSREACHHTHTPLPHPELDEFICENLEGATLDVPSNVSATLPQIA